MRLAPEVTTRLLPGPLPESEVLVDGNPGRARVSGAVLEAAVRWDEFYLLFLTDDVPAEDMLSIHLLDGKLRLVDSAMLGRACATGSFSSLALHEPDRLTFRFIGDTTWELTLLHRPAFRLPFWPEAPGVRRRAGFSRRFVLSGRPRPEPRPQGS